MNLLKSTLLPNFKAWHRRSVARGAQLLSGRPGFESGLSLNFFPASFLRFPNFCSPARIIAFLELDVVYSTEGFSFP